MSRLPGKLTQRLVRSLDQGRHGDGNGLYLVVDPSGARRWIVRVVVKGQRNRNGGALRTDLGLGGADVVPLSAARKKALEYRRMARQGLHPSIRSCMNIPTFREFAEQVHLERLPARKNVRHGQQWISTLRNYAFPKIGDIPVNEIGQREVVCCVLPFWQDKPETGRRLLQRMKTVLDVAISRGFCEGENPVTAMQKAEALPHLHRVEANTRHMSWKDIPAFYQKLSDQTSMSGQALKFICLTGTGSREALKMTWDELHFNERIWVCPAERMTSGIELHIPLTEAMVAILEPLRAVQSQYVFKGQKRSQPLSNMAVQMLLRRLEPGGVTVGGFRSTFKEWASEISGISCQETQMRRCNSTGSAPEFTYPTSDQTDPKRRLLDAWSAHVTSASE